MPRHYDTHLAGLSPEDLILCVENSGKVAIGWLHATPRKLTDEQTAAVINMRLQIPSGGDAVQNHATCTACA